MNSKDSDDHETHEDEQKNQPKPNAKNEPEQAQGILQRIQDFISNGIAKIGWLLENGQKLNCPTCGKNCHTMHQEGADSMGEPYQLNKSLSKGKMTRSTQNPPGLKLNCLHCGSPCHVVAELSTKGLTDQEEESKIPDESSNKKEEVKDSQSIAKASDQDEGTKESQTTDKASADAKEETLLDWILNYLRSTPDKTKMDCPHCGQPCHSLDSIKSDSFLQMIGNLFHLANNKVEEKTDSTKSSDSYPVGKLKCSSCEQFCHRIYKHDPDNQGSGAGETSEKDSESTDAKI
jgi:hypothetical protein